MDPEQAQIVEDPVTDLALKVAFFGGHMLIYMSRQEISAPEVLAADVANV